jgi:hypothetical protein
MDNCPVCNEVLKKTGQEGDIFVVCPGNCYVLSEDGDRSTLTVNNDANEIQQLRLSWYGSTDTPEEIQARELMIRGWAEFCKFLNEKMEERQLKHDAEMAVRREAQEAARREAEANILQQLDGVVPPGARVGRAWEHLPEDWVGMPIMEQAIEAPPRRVRVAQARPRARRRG